MNSRDMNSYDLNKKQWVRLLAGSIVVLALLFLVNNYLMFWQEWPGVVRLLAHWEWFGLSALDHPLTGSPLILAWVQITAYLFGIVAVGGYVWWTSRTGLQQDAALLAGFAAYIIRSAFWAVLLVGLVDMLISFLRVEGLLQFVVGDDLTRELGRPQFRGSFVHWPLVLLACFIAYFKQGLGFTWLALLVVLAEFQIVVTRFVFSYEQAFMGDLVRFWYAALFLFASANTLMTEGHVRVDVLYARLTRRSQAWSNIVGLLLLGLPLCWVILTLGMWDKGSSINSPLRSFEISQSGYGMYVKYLMVGFLVVFSLSMIVQFCSYLLSNAAVLLGESEEKAPKEVA